MAQSFPITMAFLPNLNFRGIKMVKNYIFDFGNVIAEFYPDKLTAPFVSSEGERKIISEVVFDRLYWDKIDDGSITDDEVKEEICKRLPKNLGEVACKVFDNWINSMTPVPDMRELILDIKKSGKKLYLLSNISRGFAQNYKNTKWIAEILDLFDGLVFSGPIGIVKPSAEIFEHLLCKYDLKSEECLFIDDSERNIVGSEKAGIKGYLFDGNAQKLREYIGY